MKRTPLFLLLLLIGLPVVPVTGHAQIIINRDPVIEKAVLEISSANQQEFVGKLAGFHNRNNLSSMTDPDKGIGAAAGFLYEKASSYIPASNGQLQVEKVYYTTGGEGTRLGREITICNVVATIHGKDKTDDRVIALLAHYDSRSLDGNDSIGYAPGANDNGSGVAALMEMVRLLAPMELPVTVKLMFLSGEEHGLHGAAYMADIAAQEKWNLIAVINNDMIGNSNASETNTHTNTVVRVFSENIPFAEDEEGRQIRVFNSAENDSPSRQLARYIKEVGERYTDNMEVKLVYRNDRFGRGGDHTPFSRKGFAAVRICETHENYDRTHQLVYEKEGIRYGDEIWAVDFEYVRKNTAVNLSAVANLAMAPAAPEEVKTDISGLTNYTELSWKAPSKGPAPAGYYVLIRETDQPHWQQKIKVAGTRIKLPFSKDNYFFAVQSVDEMGHESLPVFSTGARL